MQVEFPLTIHTLVTRQLSLQNHKELKLICLDKLDRPTLFFSFVFVLKKDAKLSAFSPTWAYVFLWDMFFFFMFLCCHVASSLTTAPVEVLLSQGCMRWMFLAQWETSHYLRGSPLAHLKGRILFNPSEDASQAPPLSLTMPPTDLLQWWKCSASLIQLHHLPMPALHKSSLLWVMPWGQKLSREGLLSCRGLDVFIQQIENQVIVFNISSKLFVVLMIKKLVLPCTFSVSPLLGYEDKYHCLPSFIHIIIRCLLYNRVWEID